MTREQQEREISEWFDYWQTEKLYEFLSFLRGLATADKNDAYVEGDPQATHEAMLRATVRMEFIDELLALKGEDELWEEVFFMENRDE